MGNLQGVVIGTWETDKLW